MPIIHVDLRFVEIKYELWALGEVLKTIEPQLEHLRAADNERTSRELGHVDDESERQMHWMESTDRTEHVLPRFIRGPYIVSLTATYEAALQELARYLQRARSAPLVMSDVRGDVIERAEKYFNHYLRLALDTDDLRLTRLKDLFALRHLIAHANGSVRGLTPDAVRRLTRLRTAYPSISVDRNAVMLAPEYLVQAFADVNSSLSALVALVSQEKPRRAP